MKNIKFRSYSLKNGMEFSSFDPKEYVSKMTTMAYNSLPDMNIMLCVELIDVSYKDIYEEDILFCDDSDIGGFVGEVEVSYVNDLCLVPAPGFYCWTRKDGRCLIDFPFHRRIIGNTYEGVKDESNK